MMLELLAGHRGGRHRRRRRGGASRSRSRAPRRRPHGPADAAARRRRGDAAARRGAPGGRASSRSPPTPTTPTVLGALRAGARGYLTKDAGAERDRARDRARRAAARRRSTRRCSATSSTRSAAQRRRPTATLPDGLTPREAEVLTLIAEGLSNAEIADRLVVSAGDRQEPRQPPLRQDRRPRPRAGGRLRLPQRARSLAVLDRREREPLGRRGLPAALRGAPAAAPRSPRPCGGRRDLDIVPTRTRFMWRMNVSAVIQNSSSSPSRATRRSKTSRSKRT